MLYVEFNAIMIVVCYARPNLCCLAFIFSSITAEFAPVFNVIFFG